MHPYAIAYGYLPATIWGYSNFFIWPWWTHGSAWNFVQCPPRKESYSISVSPSRIWNIISRQLQTSFSALLCLQWFPHVNGLQVSPEDELKNPFVNKVTEQTKTDNEKNYKIAFFGLKVTWLKKNIFTLLRPADMARAENGKSPMLMKVLDWETYWN